MGYCAVKRAARVVFYVWGTIRGSLRWWGFAYRQICVWLLRNKRSIRQIVYIYIWCFPVAKWAAVWINVMEQKAESTCRFGVQCLRIMCTYLRRRVFTVCRKKHQYKLLGVQTLYLINGIYRILLCKIYGLNKATITKKLRSDQKKCSWVCPSATSKITYFGFQNVIIEVNCRT